MRYHFTQMQGLKMQQTRLTQLCFIIGICPKESLFDRLQFIVGQIFSICWSQTIARIETDRDYSKRMVLVAIDLVEGFFDFDARTFEFYLYQTITKASHHNGSCNFLPDWFDWWLEIDFLLLSLYWKSEHKTVPSSLVNWKRSRSVLAFRYIAFG
jgi:hypothetical protein